MRNYDDQSGIHSWVFNTDAVWLIKYMQSQCIAVLLRAIEEILLTYTQYSNTRESTISVSCRIMQINYRIRVEARGPI
jgi:hypothetical protein